ncbi:MAG: hypothetical protein WDO24_27620 [Pseudomonadota bacterium]
MGKKLTDAQIAQYERNGFLFPVEGFSPDQARRYRDAMETFERAQGTELTKGHNFKRHLLFTGSTRSSTTRRFSTRSRI